jgi:hypothetical protein
MSTDFSIRPVGVPAPAPAIAPQTQAASNGVATDLPSSQSVTPADASASARNDASNLPDDADVSHQAYFDRDAATLVFQVVNSGDGQVIEQFPDDVTLRRRAYFHALDLAKGNQEPRSAATDRSA